MFGHHPLVQHGTRTTLTGSATKAAYQTCLQTLKYNNTSLNPTTTDRTVNVVVNDGFNASNTAVATVHVVAVNSAPTITAIADLGIVQDTSTGAIPFTIGDPDSAIGSLNVGATSSDQTVVPDANIALGGSGASRTITVVPAAGQTGSATITVTVSDGSLTTPETFVVTVTPPPTVTSVTPSSKPQGTTSQTVTVNGTNFIAGTWPNSSVAFSGSGITVNSVTHASASADR